ncbi:MAG: group 1 truncated hemoglobin [Alphaproteobacteria bacterium]|nr:group 1 truncated hemoglobin [Alphaproteobacteria bacterium]
MYRIYRRTNLSVSLAALAFACTAGLPALAQTAGATSAPTAPTITDGTRLFEDFGGKPGLVKIMDDFMDNLLADSRTKPFFAPADQAHIKAMLVEQFCQILNGGCVYSGKDMATAHAGMGVTEGDFYALVEDLQKAMNKNHIPFASQNRLLAALAPQHRDIVEK